MCYHRYSLFGIPDKDRSDRFVLQLAMHMKGRSIHCLVQALVAASVFIRWRVQSGMLFTSVVLVDSALQHHRASAAMPVPYTIIVEFQLRYIFCHRGFIHVVTRRRISTWMSLYNKLGMMRMRILNKLNAVISFFV